MGDPKARAAPLITPLVKHGLAMGRLWLLSDLLRTERLVAPLADVAAPPDFGYWLVKPRHPSNPAAKLFEEWIIRLIT